MLSSRKLIFGVLFLISACGFSPIYTNNNSANLNGQISIQEPNTQNDFVFYSRLTDRFGKASGKYILNYAITTAKEDKAINFDGTVHRVEISSFVTFSLKDTATGVQIFSDKEEMYLSYSNFGSTAAVLNAERTTNKQLVVLLADKVADRISLILVDQGS
jgi:hypothetical protein